MAACPPRAPEQISRPGYDAVTLGRCAIVNRIQALVLSFFLVVWVSLVAILAAAPEVYDQALRLPPGRHRPVEIAFLTALSAFIALLSIGVLRRWRWTFWLILVAFLAGAVRVPVAICSWSTPCQQMSQVGTSCCKL